MVILGEGSQVGRVHGLFYNDDLTALPLPACRQARWLAWDHLKGVSVSQIAGYDDSGGFVPAEAGGFTLHVYKESDPSVRGFYRYAMPAGKSWRFHHWIYRNNAFIDEYREFSANVYQYDSDPIQRIDTFDDAALPSGWAASASGVSVSGGQVHVTGDQTWNTYAYRTGSVIDGSAARFTFKVGATDAEGCIFFDYGNFGQPAYRRWGILLAAGLISRDSYAGSSREIVNMMTLQANTWYEAELVVDSARLFRLKVWERDNPSVSSENTASHGDWSGLSWRFMDQIYRGTVDLEEYRELFWGANGIGRRTAMLDASGKASWTYDTRGRMTLESKTVAGSGVFVTQYGYNSADLLDWMKYPADNTGVPGEQVSYAYHPQMAPKSSLSNLNPAYYYAQNITYDAAGRVDVLSLGAPDLASNPLLKTDYDYFGWDTQGGRLQFLKTGTTSDPISLQKFEYDYDLAGNIDWIKDYKAGGTQTQSFHYDALDRLIDATASGGSGGTYPFEQYTYHPDTGNLASKAGVSYTYNAQVTCAAGNRTIAHAVSAAGGKTYTYDCNGNMTVRNYGGGVVYNLSYDVENRLSSVSGAATASFVYDGDGNRVKGTVAGVETAYLGNYFEWTGSTSTMKRYYYAGSMRIAMREGSTLSWLLSDHLGSTSVTANASGVRTGEVRYRPWGEDRYTWGTTPTSYRYTGQRSEMGSIGLYYYGARWYDSYLNRWTSPDSDVPESQGVQAWDRYAFVNNNPVRYVDPSGHGACDNSKYAEDLCRHYRPPTSNSILDSVEAKRVTWDELPPSYQKILRDDGWDPETYNAEFVTGNCTDISGTHEDLAVYIPVGVIGIRGLYKIAQHIIFPLLGIGHYVTSQGTTLWPSHFDGRQIINGITYSVHALEQMAPVGLGGRGVPPSIVENALKFGTRVSSGEPNVLKITYENVVVVWNSATNVVITVINLTMRGR